MLARTARALTVVFVVTSAGWTAASAGAQQEPDPRQIAIDWLTARSTADAVKHLPPAAVEQIRAFQKTAPKEQEMLLKMFEMILAPLPLLQEMGATVKASGAPIRVITMSGGDEPAPGSMEITVLAASVAGDTATVPLRVRSDGGAEERGAIGLRRDGRSWRIVSADLGARMRLPRFDTPNFLHAAASYLTDELARARANGLLASAKGDLRAMISAQMAYASMNGGYFVPPECLVDLQQCKPPFATDIPFLHEGALAVAEYSGQFYPGPTPTAAEIKKANAVAQSLNGWAFVFAPEPGSTLKLQAVCADSTSRLCLLPDASVKPTGGLCPATCQEVK